MEIIERIKKLKGSGYTLTTKSGLYITISEDSLVKHRLLKGEEISEELLLVIQEEALFDIGYQKALVYLSYQLRSQKEIIDHLKKHDIDNNNIRKVIEKLKELSLLDDLLFAKSYVRTSVRTTDKGPQGIREFLIKKGINKEIISEALLEYSVEDQYQSALKTAEKSTKKYRSKSFKETKNKIRQVLFTKGFSSELIDQVMNDLELKEDPEDEYLNLVLQGEKLWKRHTRLEPYKRRQKIKQSLYQKGFSLDDIDRFIDEKELELS